MEPFFSEEATHSLPQLVHWVEYVNFQICHLLTRSEDATVVDRAKTFVESHILGEVNRNQIAEYAHVSPEYLSRVFRRKTGQSLVEYITGVKMNAAKEMLTHSDKPVSQIASQLGYGNFSYFSQLFRDFFSLSPSEYRKMYQANPME